MNTVNLGIYDPIAVMSMLASISSILFGLSVFSTSAIALSSFSESCVLHRVPAAANSKQECLGRAVFLIEFTTPLLFFPAVNSNKNGLDLNSTAL